MAGHSIRGTTSWPLERPAYFYTLLREPVARTLSEYFYFCRSLGYKKSLEEYVETEGRGNFMVRALSGTDDADDAIALLKRRFSLVGIVERFDDFLEGLSLLDGKSYASFKGFVAYNASRIPGSSSARASKELLARIAEQNAEDIRLYNYVRDSLVGSRGYYLSPDVEPRVAIEQPSRIALRLGRLSNRLYRNFLYKPYCLRVPGLYHALPYYKKLKE
jgi:hypothetical protein